MPFVEQSGRLPRDVKIFHIRVAIYCAVWNGTDFCICRLEECRNAAVQKQSNTTSVTLGPPEWGSESPSKTAVKLPGQHIIVTDPSVCLLLSNKGSWCCLLSSFFSYSEWDLLLTSLGDLDLGDNNVHNWHAVHRQIMAAINPTVYFPYVTSCVYKESTQKNEKSLLFSGLLSL